jgi:hypothetical protein
MPQFIKSIKTRGRNIKEDDEEDEVSEPQPVKGMYALCIH